MCHFSYGTWQVIQMKYDASIFFVIAGSLAATLISSQKCIGPTYDAKPKYSPSAPRHINHIKLSESRTHALRWQAQSINLVLYIYIHV